MMTSTDDVFSEFEGIRRRMEKTWQQVLGRLAVVEAASAGPKQASSKQR